MVDGALMVTVPSNLRMVTLERALLTPVVLLSQRNITETEEMRPMIAKVIRRLQGLAKQPLPESVDRGAWGKQLALEAWERLSWQGSSTVQSRYLTAPITTTTPADTMIRWLSR